MRVHVFSSDAVMVKTWWGSRAYRKHELGFWYDSRGRKIADNKLHTAIETAIASRGWDAVSDRDLEPAD